MRQLSLDITSDPVRLAPTRRAVEAFCVSCGFDERAVADIGLCVNEAMANITRHAYSGAIDRPIHLDAVFDDNELKINLRDWGNGKDPSGTAPRHDPLTPGGLGLVCLTSLMDEMKFHAQPDGMLLTMKRRRIPFT